MAFAAGEGRGVDGEHHRDGRLVDLDLRQRLRGFGVGDGFADGDAFHAGDGQDVARAGVVSSTRFRPSNEYSLVMLASSATGRPACRCRLRRRAQRAVEHAADGDAARGNRCSRGCATRICRIAVGIARRAAGCASRWLRTAAAGLSDRPRACVLAMPSRALV